jgi:hypothetical protein
MSAAASPGSIAKPQLTGTAVECARSWRRSAIPSAAGRVTRTAFLPAQGLAKPAWVNTRWPVGPVTRSTNFCASAGCELCLSTTIG